MSGSGEIWKEAKPQQSQAGNQFRIYAIRSTS
jgi:hypothetical protein